MNFSFCDYASPTDIARFDFLLEPLSESRGFEPIGSFKGKSASQIGKSFLGIGFETLDRDTFNPEDVYDILPGCGVKHARLQTGWLKCERERGVYDFSKLDSQVENLLARKIQPWFNVSFGNPLYTPVAEYEKIIEEAKPNLAPARIRGYCGETPVYFGDDGMAGWCAYLEALVKHFSGRVTEFEIWNEPFGLGDFWKQNGHMPYPGLDGISRARRCAEDYVKLVRKSAEVVHRVNPEAKVIANTALDTMFTDEIVRAGITDCIDILSYHLYPRHEKETYAKVQHVREILNRAGGRHIPIRQGESGFPSEHRESLSLPTEYNQAKYIAKRILTDLRCGAEMSSIFTVTDFLHYYPNGESQHFGVIDAAKKKPKLGFFTIQSFAPFSEHWQSAPDLLATFTQRNGDSNIDTTEFDVTIVGLRCFGIPIFALWREGKTDISHPEVLGELTLFLFPEEHFQTPVVFDPIRQTLYRSTHAKATSWSCGAMGFNPFPMLDSPLLVTDLSLFQKLGILA